jgi:hypothetical protein
MICMVGVFVFERWVGMEIGFGEGKRERIILIIIIGGWLEVRLCMHEK